MLRAVTAEGAWVEWILFVLEAVRASAESTMDKIAAIRSCQDNFAERARGASNGGRDAQLLAVVFEQPYCRIATVVARCEVSRQTASSWLHALAGAGLLDEVKVAVSGSSSTVSSWRFSRAPTERRPRAVARTSHDGESDSGHVSRRRRERV